MANTWIPPTLSDKDRTLLKRAWEGDTPRVSIKDGMRLSRMFEGAIQVESRNGADTRAGYCMFFIRERRNDTLREQLVRSGVSIS